MGYIMWVYSILLWVLEKLFGRPEVPGEPMIMVPLQVSMKIPPIPEKKIEIYPAGTWGADYFNSPVADYVQTMPLGERLANEMALERKARAMGQWKGRA